MKWTFVQTDKFQREKRVGKATGLDVFDTASVTYLQITYSSANKI